MTADQRRDLREAMLAAFDEKGLASLASLRLDENLEAIAGSGPLPDRVLQLIRWAERQGRLTDLLNGCLLEVPRNTDLASAIARLRVALPPMPSLATPPATAPLDAAATRSSVGDDDVPVSMTFSERAGDSIVGRHRPRWVQRVGRRVAVSAATIAGLMILAFATGLFAGYLWGSSSVGPVLGTKAVSGGWQPTTFGVALRVTGVRRVSSQRVRISLEYRNDEPTPVSIYVRRSNLGTGGDYSPGTSVNNLPMAAPGASVPFDIEFSRPPSPSGESTLHLEVGPNALQVTSVTFPVTVK